MSKFSNVAEIQAKAKKKNVLFSMDVKQLTSERRNSVDNPRRANDLKTEGDTRGSDLLDNSIRIRIGNHMYKANDEFNTISEKILQMCNFYHLKSPNNSGTLKAGEGKAAFTNGMSVRDFRYKYNLK